MKKNLYCLIGPSGSGKTTVGDVLVEYCGMTPVESYTTRPPRYEGEKGHVFVSEQEFKDLGEMVAYTKFSGYEYGITKEMLDKCDLYVVDVAGYRMLKEKYKSRMSYGFVFDAHKSTCAKRMIVRGDSIDQVIERLTHDAEAFKDMKELQDICILDVNRMSVTEAADAIWTLIKKFEEENE